ncbi:MAG: tetratricopeptide repeat protein [Acidobacteria bacterium]|nr:tetratricopeptide repeat protein [Acidobacteriota bacterium]NIM61473.1 tetratricopeptide repeat protein [Acidobacteriota bacterium]NIO58105.1 tetratricopeptide repeat protein [Acidobacteriota bacterium]NIQ29117.1 tetratricopeptide repeat protein [Acidobacteriota bacterium]NIQ83668.1 tetratricopeptide repeat protein [Acidobacteriota bacterium]
MSSRRFLFWALCVLSIVFAARAVYGLVAGLSYSEGRRNARLGRYEQALPLLDRSAVGELSAEVRWLAGEVRLGQWQRRIEAGEAPEDVAPLLAEAFVDASAALASSPASGWYWMALGKLYHQAERLSIHRQGVPLTLLAEDRWAFVGHPGRVAIGLMRIALEREPNWYPFHDQLAYVYYDYRLRPETLEAVYASALALPVYELHPYRSLRPPDLEILDAFARGAHDSLGRAPWMRPVRHRIALGRIEVRRENWEAAEEQLRQALELDGVPLNVAEAHYYLGLSLVGQERYDEARVALIEAEKQAPMKPPAVFAQADLAERLDQWDLALDLWAEVKRLEPHRLDASLRLAEAARVTGNHERAAHNLREAIRKHPERYEPLVSLVRVFIDQGELGKARAAFADLDRRHPDLAATAALRRDLEAGRRP